MIEDTRAASQHVARTDIKLASQCLQALVVYGRTSLRAVGKIMADVNHENDACHLARANATGVIGIATHCPSTRTRHITTNIIGALSDQNGPQTLETSAWSHHYHG
jgi:hypothetical protein